MSGAAGARGGPLSVPRVILRAYLTGYKAPDSYALRGPVALYYWSPLNEWDGSEPMTGTEKAAIDEALTAGCQPA